MVTDDLVERAREIAEKWRNAAWGEGRFEELVSDIDAALVAERERGWTEGKEWARSMMTPNIAAARADATRQERERIAKFADRGHGGYTGGDLGAAIRALADQPQPDAGEATDAAHR